MDSTVRPRPNHYEALGLEPTASTDDIAQAYASVLRRPCTIGQIALAGMAYEVLRDPAKRQAYDELIGLAKPMQPALLQWSVKSPFAAPYLRTARAAPVEQPRAIQPEPPPTPTQQQTPYQAQDDERLPSFLATALRDIAKPEPLTGAEVSTQPEKPSVSLEKHRSPQPSAPELSEIEDMTFDWRRIGMGAGALVIVASLFGVWAGSDATNDAQPPEPQMVAKALLPPATPFPSTIAGTPTSAPEAGAAPRTRRGRMGASCAQAAAAAA